MRLSHICHRCGTELARIAAPPDPIYHLPIVVCRCGTAHVRRPHPTRALLRSFARYAGLVIRLATFAFFFCGPALIVGIFGVNIASLNTATTTLGFLTGNAPLSDVAQAFSSELRPTLNSREHQATFALMLLVAVVPPAVASGLLLAHQPLHRRILAFVATAMFMPICVALLEGLERIIGVETALTQLKIFVVHLFLLLAWTILVSILHAPFALMASHRMLQPRPSLARALTRIRRKFR